MIFKAQTQLTTTIIINGQTFTIDNKDDRLKTINQLIKEKKEAELLDLLTSRDLIKTAVTNTNNKFKFTGDKAFYGDVELPLKVVETIRRYIASKESWSFLELFFNNCLQNPDPKSVFELFLFLEAGKMPITDDGFFLAYRKVDQNYMSLHSNPDGTRNRNKVGDIPVMDRAKCDNRRNVTCSTGLHFASLDYMPSYGSTSGRIMMVKIHPSDVVSIPNDYKDTKGRCCKYEVVAEHFHGNQPSPLAVEPEQTEEEVSGWEDDEATDDVFVVDVVQTHKSTSKPKSVVKTKDIEKLSNCKGVRYRNKTNGYYIKREVALEMLADPEQSKLVDVIYPKS